MPHGVPGRGHSPTGSKLWLLPYEDKVIMQVTNVNVIKRGFFIIITPLYSFALIYGEIRLRQYGIAKPIYDNILQKAVIFGK